VDRVDDPDEGDQQGNGIRGKLTFFLWGGTQTGQQPAQEQEQEETAEAVEQNIGAVVSHRAAAPQPVVKHIGPVLNRAVVGRERIEKEVVPEDFESEDGAAEKWIFADEVEIVPDQVAAQRRGIDEKAGQQAKEPGHEWPRHPMAPFFNPERQR